MSPLRRRWREARRDDPERMGADDGREMPRFDGINWTIDVQGNQTVLD